MNFTPTQAIERAGHYARLAHEHPTPLNMACLEAFLALTSMHKDEDEWRRSLERSKEWLCQPVFINCYAENSSRGYQA